MWSDALPSWLFDVWCGLMRLKLAAGKQKLIRVAFRRWS